MATLSNLVEVLTYRPVQQEYVLAPGQVYLRGGPVGQPFTGIVRDRPIAGQVWPRGEWEDDTSTGINIPPAPLVVNSVVVTPSAVTRGATQTAQLEVHLFDQNGDELFDRSVAWTSSDESKATVTQDGLVTAVATGSATITATSEGVSDTCAVTISAGAATVASVTVAPTPFFVLPSGTRQLTAHTYDSDGVELFGQTVTWDSSNDAIATVDSTGLVTWVSGGLVTITATSNGHDGFAEGVALFAPDIADAVLYFSCDSPDEFAAYGTIFNTGTSPLTGLTTTQLAMTARVASAAREQGVTMDAFAQNGQAFAAGWQVNGEGSSYDDFVASPGPIYSAAGDSDWTVSVWMNRALGRWGTENTPKYASLWRPSWDVFEKPRLEPLRWTRTGTDTFDRLHVFVDSNHGIFADYNTGVRTTDLVAGWNHLVVTNDVSGSGLLKVYLNNVLVFTGAALDLTAMTTATTDFEWWYIGGKTYTDLSQWGSMDEVYVFDRAIDASEVDTLYNL